MWHSLEMDILLKRYFAFT